jgi:hypothetical protein
VRAAALLLAVACGWHAPGGAAQTLETSAASPVETPTTPPTCEPPTPTLAEALEQAGFQVAEGRSAFLLDFIEDCCDLGLCVGNNPSSPYEVWWVPPGPGQTAPDPWPDAEGRSPIWHLGAHEALIWIGQTPPSARYSGWRSYLETQYVPETGEHRIVFGVMGDTLNGVNLQTEAPASGGRTAIVTTGDAAVLRAVTDALVASGVPPTAINLDAIPPSLAQLGLGTDSDTFTMIHRVALFDDPVAGDAYLQQPTTGLLLRASRRAEAPAEPLPAAPLRENGTGVAETLDGAVLALEDAVVAAWPTFTATRLGWVQRQYPESYTCIENGFCGDDQRDRLVSFSTPFELGPRDFAVALGVNHAATGKAAYANVSAAGQYWHVGVDAVEDPDFPGSAQAYVPEEPAADQLFAWHFARDCSGRTHCVEIPYTCPGAPPGTLLNLTFRAYLEEATGTAPAGDELVPERVVVFRATP